MGGMEDMNVGTGVADMDEQVEDMAYFNEKARGQLKRRGVSLKMGVVLPFTNYDHRFTLKYIVELGLVCNRFQF